jgi:hypothetical protein
LLEVAVQDSTPVGQYELGDRESFNLYLAECGGFNEYVALELGHYVKNGDGMYESRHMKDLRLSSELVVYLMACRNLSERRKDLSNYKGSGCTGAS